MPILSKSKIIAFRQCPKRLWLEIHRPDLKEDSAATQASYKVGYEVGEVARQLYDEDGQGVLIDIETEGFKEAFRRSAEVLQHPDRPVFEAGFQAAGACAFADILLPDGSGSWRMIEVKSSGSVKDYHRDDVAVQAFVARAMGVPLSTVAVAHVDTQWVYPGQENYRGLLVEEDLTDEVAGRSEEVAEWIRRAQVVARQKTEPEVATGPHCWSPFECGFCTYCHKDVVEPEFPLDWLPWLSDKKREEFATLGVSDLRQVPPEMLNEVQQRVASCTVDNTTYFNPQGARQGLRGLGFPARFLDFETIGFAVPRWEGTKPYQQIPFQFSVHTLTKNGKLSHAEFLDLTGRNPSRSLAESLLEACGTTGPVFVYNEVFEKRILGELATRLPDLSDSLKAIIDRVVDLYPIARKNFYHPSQCGSWSIKSVLPAIKPELAYTTLDGVGDGGMAIEAYHEAIHPETTPERREQIRRELLAYCHRDTLATVELWKFFTGKSAKVEVV